MDVWDIYSARISGKGSTKRDAALQREKRFIRTHLKDNLSYQTCLVDGVERQVAIINSDNFDEKTIISLPDEDLRHGALVEWMDNKWLITDRDANTTLHTRCTMLQCNHFLRWIDKTGKICGQWANVSDGTKYLTGEFEDKFLATTRGDTRLSVILSRTEDTLNLGRENRFLIDDEESHEHIAYSLTKPLRMGRVFNGNGVYAFVVQEVETTDDDNFDLLIADYYKYFPHPNASDDANIRGGTNPNREVYI